MISCLKGCHKLIALRDEPSLDLQDVLLLLPQRVKSGV